MSEIAGCYAVCLNGTINYVPDQKFTTRGCCQDLEGLIVNDNTTMFYIKLIMQLEFNMNLKNTFFHYAKMFSVHSTILPINSMQIVLYLAQFALCLALLCRFVHIPLF